MKKHIFLICLMSMALLNSCYNEEEYLPTNVDPNNILVNLTAVTPSIPADGASFTYIEAELNKDALDNKSTVTFTTTKGTFDNNTKTASVTATLIDVDGTNKRIARVKLNSSLVIENADVTATVSNVSKTITVPFTNLPYDTYLTVNSSSATVLSDGASFTYINVEQPIAIANDVVSVTFTTSAGTFDNSTKTTTKSSTVNLVDGVYKRIVQVKLTSGKTEETAQIEVAVKGTSKSLVVNFVKAFPETIRLNINSPSITTGFANSVQILTLLGRSVGVPSINNDASLTVIDTNMVSRGTFINYSNKSDGTGTITNKFTLGTDSYKGKLTIVASTTDALGKIINSQYQIIAQ